jgi:hypothetical protein
VRRKDDAMKTNAGIKKIILCLVRICLQMKTSPSILRLVKTPTAAKGSYFAVGENLPDRH